MLCAIQKSVGGLGLRSPQYVAGKSWGDGDVVSILEEVSAVLL